MAKGPKKAKQKVPDKLKPPDTLSAEPSNAKFPEEQIELAAVEAPKETAAKGHIDPNGQSRQDIQGSCVLIMPAIMYNYVFTSIPSLATSNHRSS